MSSQTSTTDDEGRIRSLIDDVVGALRAKDADGVLRHHTPDFVQFSLAPPLVSAAAAKEGLNAWFATWEGPIGYEVHDLAVTAGGDTAFSHSLNRMSGTKTDGSKPELWFRQTICFQKTGGAWKIVHEHESVPFYMDGSFKAAVDLEP